ncbi:MAG: lysylphosphatidylglycerol synthase domain-containing protein [Alphaproteobacteria bacterium]
MSGGGEDTESRGGRRGLRLAAFGAFALGLSLAVGLVLYYDAGRIFALVGNLGWAIGVIVLVHAVPVAATMLAWRSLLLPFGIRQPAALLFWARWVADSVNQLLPVAQIGGEFVRGRLVVQRGAPAAPAAATIVVDTMAGFLSLILFILIGLGLLASWGGNTLYMNDFLIGAALAGFVLAALYLMQRAGGISRMVRLMSPVLGARQMETLTGGAAALDRRLEELYARPRAIFMATVWRLAGWFGGLLGIWVIARFLGYPITFAEALVLEAVGQAVRNLGFAIPGALGAQEAGYVLGAVAIGMPEEAALALSLTKRARDILIGVPVLLSWQWSEGHRLFGRRT